VHSDTKHRVETTSTPPGNTDLLPQGIVELLKEGKNHTCLRVRTFWTGSEEIILFYLFFFSAREEGREKEREEQRNELYFSLWQRKQWGGHKYKFSWEGANQAREGI
jgi:hypothetical protein